MSGGTLFSSEYCPGGQYSRGDIIHSDTVSVQISVHSPVHESSPESRVHVLHLPDLYPLGLCGVMRVHDEHVDDVSLHTYIHTHTHTYIHRYGDFLVVLISVGLAQARPN